MIMPTGGELVQNLDHYSRAMERLEWRVKRGEDMVVDLETTGLDPYHGDRLCGIAIDAEEAGSYYFSFRHQGANTPGNLPLGRLRDFRKLLSAPRVTYTGFNYGFDLQMLNADDIPLANRIEDVMLAAHLMNENEPKTPDGQFRLKLLSDKYLGPGSSDQEQELKEILRRNGWGKGDMWKLPANVVAPYAVQDVRLTRNLRDFYVKHLRTWDLYDIWQAINHYLYVTILMIRRGMLIDTAMVQRYMEEADRMVGPSLQKLHTMAGYPINPASHPQLKAWLGLESTAKEVVEDIMDSMAPDELKDALRTLQEYRGWSKVNGTYYRPYLQECDAGGVLHPHLNLIGTVSGRLSCYAPNLQAVPRKGDVFKVKNVFVARPGYVIIQADYSQAELRIGTHYAREDNMATHIRAGVDLHSQTAADLGIPRNVAKRINFGIVYGIGAVALARQLRIPEDQARQYLNKYHKQYPGFRALYRQAERIAEERGYIRMFTGRVRHYDQNNPAHKASSNLIQGSVAEMMRLAVTRAFDELQGLDAHMLLTVHDSLMVEARGDQVGRVASVMKRSMEDFDFYVPLKVDIQVGKSWGALVDWTPDGSASVVA